MAQQWMQFKEDKMHASEINMMACKYRSKDKYQSERSKT